MLEEKDITIRQLQLERRWIVEKTNRGRNDLLRHRYTLANSIDRCENTEGENWRSLFSTSKQLSGIPQQLCQSFLRVLFPSLCLPQRTIGVRMSVEARSQCALAQPATIAALRNGKQNRQFLVCSAVAAAAATPSSARPFSSSPLQLAKGVHTSQDVCPILLEPGTTATTACRAKSKYSCLTSEEDDGSNEKS